MQRCLIGARPKQSRSSPRVSRNASKGSSLDASSVILAIGSPPGRSGRGMVRASGRGVFALFDALATSPVDRERGIGSIRMGPAGCGLPGLLLRCPGPGSYTGEDVLELQLPGQPVLLDQLIDAAIDIGSSIGVPTRRAEPGEFTARAWHNGRLSLTEAEGVAALIAARSDAELHAAALLKAGRLGSIAAEAADRIAGLLALVEAGIDFTDEEDVVAIGNDELRDRLESEGDVLRTVLDRSVGMDVIQALPVVVICGPANAGKSTLFNALLSHRRAVVAEVAGTTRDAIVEPLVVDDRGGEVLLVDVAGFERDPASHVEQKMQVLARSFIDEADVLLHCLPPGCEESWLDDPRVIRVRTKSDLEPAAGEEELCVAARVGEGVEHLRQRVARKTLERLVHLSADAVALQPRHEAGLREALQCLSEAILVIEREPASSELVALHLRGALDSTAILAGTIAPDEVLGRVFASFCIGK